jgi:hypothetical protein
MFCLVTPRLAAAAVIVKSSSVFILLTIAHDYTPSKLFVN